MLAASPRGAWCPSTSNILTPGGGRPGLPVPWPGALRQGASSGRAAPARGAVLPAKTNTNTRSLRSNEWPGPCSRCAAHSGVLGVGEDKQQPGRAGRCLWKHRGVMSSGCNF